MNISQIINSSIISKNNFSPNGKYLLVPKGKNLILYSLYPDIKKLDKMLFNSTINYLFLNIIPLNKNLINKLKYKYIIYF